MHVRVMPPCLYSVELVRGVMSKVVACATVNWWPLPMEHAYTKIMMGIICIDTLVELVIARLIIVDTVTFPGNFNMKISYASVPNKWGLNTRDG